MSERFTLNAEDLKKWATNALVFAGPDLVVFFGALANKFQAQDAFLAVLVMNLLLDLLKKYLAGK